MDVFWAAPPVSRTLAAATFVLSVSLYTGFLPFIHFVFFPEQIFKLPPEIWRVVTAFLITGPKLSILLEPFFLYTYGSQLETEPSRFPNPGDFFTYVVFIGAAIVGLCGYGLGGWVFLNPLLLGFVYTLAQMKPNSQASLFVITIPMKWMPYAMLLITFVMSGSIEAMIQQATGIIAAHLYEFLTRIWPRFGGGSNWIQTPALVGRWFGGDANSTGGTPQNTTYGAVYTPSAGTAGQNTNSGGTTSGFSSGNAWKARGPGRRLGGE